MTKYVALLRGINVGGNAKVEMPRLKSVFEKCGCQNVQTYINSGNVIFDDSRLADKLAAQLAGAIQAEFKLSVPVVLRAEPNITMLAKKIPADWLNDKIQKTDVMFLWDEIDNQQILSKLSINPAYENALYLPGALVWNIDRRHAVRGGIIKLIKTELYQKMTVRNINTVRKLARLMV